ncbi:hypothetical protein [Photorhabdus viridis]|uniref:hypothetical protein n=1 Tax=Photorhabdus viridis TaxID=3163327 RepID=UPI0033072EF9
MLKLHGVVNKKLIDSHAQDFQQLIKWCVAHDNAPEKLYHKGTDYWVFQTNYYSKGSQVRSNAVNLMYYDDFVSIIKHCKELVVICVANRLSVIDVDYVIEQIKYTEKYGGISISYWPLFGLNPYIYDDNEIKAFRYSTYELSLIKGGILL